jgi:toxin ParE1/3/4
LTRVGEYRYSLLAEADADEIAAFTIETWDHRQAERYLSGLEALCQKLADGEAIGRACPAVGPDLFRIGYVSHVVFFRRRPYGVRVVRILHGRLRPEIHTFDEDEE